MQSFPTEITDCTETHSMGYKEDLQRVHAKIDGVTDRFDNIPVKTPPNVWQKVATIFAVCAFGLAIYTHTSLDVKNDVKIEVSDQLKQPLKQIGEIAGDIREIKGKLEVLDPLVRELTIKRIAEAEKLNPKELTARLPELKYLAKIAKTENVIVKPERVETVGKRLIEIDRVDAWDTAIEFANYKSFLNASLSVAVNNVIGDGTIVTHYVAHWPIGMNPAILRAAGAVPKEQAAQFLTIGQPDPNISSLIGNDWIIVSDGALTLDNMQLKKVIFRNVYVFYDGGPLNMKDVYFINCTFAVKQQANGRRLVATVLDPSPAVSFNAS